MIHDRFLKPKWLTGPTSRRSADPRTDGGVTEEALARLKPDIMVYQGIRPGKLTDALKTDIWPKNFKIQIVEVGYSNDWCWEDKRKEKKEAYTALEKHLNAMGWRTESEQLVLGSRGCVYLHTAAVLNFLGIRNKKEQKTIAKQLGLHGAEYAARMLGACAKADRTDGVG